MGYGVMKTSDKGGVRGYTVGIAIILFCCSIVDSVCVATVWVQICTFIIDL